MNISLAGQKRLVIVGATGMVGGYALRYAIDHPLVANVTVIGRRKLGISHPKEPPNNKLTYDRQIGIIIGWADLVVK